MGENFDFEAMFAKLSEDNAELAAAAEGIAAEVAAAPAKDGLVYVKDFDSTDGHSISRYAMTVTGKHVFDVLIDNFMEVPVPAEMGKAPAGVSAHTIMIVKPGSCIDPIMTTGLAFRTPHQDGTGTHIDGRTVQSYVYPRAVRLLVQLYVA